jgi:hypothetical protein
LKSLAFEQVAGGGRDGARLLEAEHPSLPGTENLARRSAIERHKGVFADSSCAIRKIEHVKAQGAGFGIVDQQAGVIQAKGAAQ